MSPSGHRRRSHSTCEVSSHPELEQCWRSPHKRTYQSSFFPYPDLSSPQKWDVDLWRQGKRARRNYSPDSNWHEYPRSLGNNTLSSSTFLSNSADFQLFPSRGRNPPNARRSFHHLERPSALMEDLDLLQTDAELHKLRSDAFGKLHESIEEGGENLIRKMRDYEDQRSRSAVHAKAKEAGRRGRKRASISSRSKKAMDTGLGSEDDTAWIFAGDFTIALSPSQKKRALSLGPVPEGANAHYTYLDSGSSPEATSLSGYLSDEDEENVNVYPGPENNGIADHDLIHAHAQAQQHHTASGYTPALSQSTSLSACSSLISLPLPQPMYPQSTYQGSPSFKPSPAHTTLHPAPSSRYEKAIAALSLAIANGAGGLNDYSALQFEPSLPKTEEDQSQVGELWH